MSDDQTIEDQAIVVRPTALPSCTEQRYVATFGLGAVVVFADPTSSCISIAATADPGEALTATRRAWPKDATPVLVAAVWAHSLRAAQQIVTLALADDLRGVGKDGSRRIPIDVEKAMAAIHWAAARLQIAIVAHDVVLYRARMAAGAISTALDAARDSGTLKQFNRQYRQRRRAAQAQGRKFPLYTVVRQRSEGALARAAANGDAVNFDEMFAVADER